MCLPEHDYKLWNTSLLLFTITKRTVWRFSQILQRLKILVFIYKGAQYLVKSWMQEASLLIKTQRWRAIYILMSWVTTHKNPFRHKRPQDGEKFSTRQQQIIAIISRLLKKYNQNNLKKEKRIKSKYRKKYINYYFKIKDQQIF